LHCKGGSTHGDFIPWLKKELESRGFEVQAPNLPHTDEPDDVEQTEFVKKHCTFDEQTVVIGHSFGGIVALRLLEQGIKVNRAVLVSAPFSGNFKDKKGRPTVIAALKKGFDVETIKKNSLGFSFLYDLNDYVVPISDGEEYAKHIGFGMFKVKAQKPHFHNPEEPEILSVALGSIKVFTTRPDTIYGATYLVLSPEHQLANIIAPHVSNSIEVLKYIDEAKNKTDIQRSALEKEKTGVELKGVKAINPANGEKIPIWVADYVLMGYGTGAIMAVPQHDERDRQFAEKYKLPIVDKPLIPIAEAIQKLGTKKVQYKLRDWVFSRQRYWGEPIPIIHCEECGIVPVPDNDLPVKLPPVKKYEPTGTGESPLASISKWVNVKCPSCGGKAKRETNTMPQWAGSSWYWLRYTDPKNKKSFADIKKQKYWTPVDVYFGGMEHTTLHLLYSRFWNLFLYDQGLVTTIEPYVKRQPHGIVLGPDGEKMSKSRGNVVNPDLVVKEFGADTLRMYELFLGPHEAMVSWNDKGIVGVRRFLDRIWDWIVIKSLSQKTKVEDSDKAQRAIHRLIKKVTEDIEQFHFNTAISAFMEFHNQIKDEAISTQSLKTFLILLYPFAPHISEELHAVLGGKKSLQQVSWPTFEPSKIVEDTADITVQVHGKVNGKIIIQRKSSDHEVNNLALVVDSVAKMLSTATIQRIIFVLGRVIECVV